MRYRIRFAPEARRDLENLYVYIAKEAGPDRALAYVERIEKFCVGFADFPERGISGTISFRGCALSASSVESPLHSRSWRIR